MSNYYDTSRPYSLEDYNSLINDVNNILENPPDGCIALPPLEELEAPHIGNIDDIKIIREALEQTCPDISFSTELQLWKTEVIDEIEEQMAKAWCECEESELTTKQINTGIFKDIPLQASPSEDCCCETVDGSGTNPLCGTSPHLEVYHIGEYYPPAEQPDINTQSAWDANIQFQNALGHVLESGQKIVENQVKVDSYTSLYDNYIQLFQQTQNQTYLQYACEYGNLAKESQEDVDEWVSSFTTWYPLMLAREVIANDTSWATLQQLLYLSGRYPVDINLWTLYFAELQSTYAWRKWIHPVNDTYDHFSNFIPIGYVKVERDNADPGWGPGRNIGFSPNGTPYLKTGSGIYSFILHIAHPYVTRMVRTYCDNWGGNSCLINGVSVPACTWSDWYEVNHSGQSHWWLPYDELPFGGTCAGANETYYYTWTSYVRVTYYSDRPGKDYTQIQLEKWTEYLNWYEEHPRYDNRHEAYC